MDKNNSHIFISIYSFLMTNNKEIKLYDFELNKYFLSDIEKKYIFTLKLMKNCRLYIL